jgi:L,D-transpeptidase ErfK/SrfK
MGGPSTIGARRLARALLVVLVCGVAGAVHASWSEEDFFQREPVRYRVTPGTPDGAMTLIGQLTTYVIEPGDTLLDVARYFALGHNEIVGANPGVDVWIPPPGEVVILPTEFILPRSRTGGVVVNIPEMRLYYFHGKTGEITTYPVGLGRDEWRTPVGSFKIRSKTENPTWVIPESIRKEHIERDGDYRTSIPGGAPDNPLGSYRLSLSLPMYGLHGTNVPWGVGMQVSHGCIRLYEEGIAKLYHDVAVGTSGELVYQPVKVGMRSGLVYMEAHADIYRMTPDPEAAARALLDQQGWSDRVDWELVRRVLAEESGLPVLISRADAPVPEREEEAPTP